MKARPDQLIILSAPHGSGCSTNVWHWHGANAAQAEEEVRFQG
jgi:hypothetical protein